MLRIGVKTSMWNPWHGCHKFSTGCQHCYVYRTDGKYGKDSSVVAKKEKYNLQVQQKKNKTYKIYIRTVKQQKNQRSVSFVYRSVRAFPG